MPTVKHVAMATAFTLYLIPENDTINDIRIVKSASRHVDSVLRHSYPHTVGIARRASITGYCG